MGSCPDTDIDPIFSYFFSFTGSTFFPVFTHYQRMEDLGNEFV